MDGTDLAAWTRNSDTKLLLSNIRAEWQGKVSRGHGTLCKKNGNFHLCLRGQTLDMGASGCFEPGHGWNIEASLAGGPTILACKMPTEAGSGGGGSYSIFKMSRLVLKHQVVRRGRFRAFGTLTQYPTLFTCNHKNPVTGNRELRLTCGAFEAYLLRTKDGYEVSLEHRVSHPYPVNRFKQMWEALLESISFVHGQDAYPQHFRLMENAVCVEEYITIDVVSGNSSFRPAHEFMGDPVQLLEKAWLFLSSKEGKEFGRYLWLARHACIGNTQLDIGNQALCSCLEGMRNRLSVLFLPPRRPSPKFAFAKKATCTALSSLVFMGWASMKNILIAVRKSYDYKPNELKRLSEHFGIEWEGGLELASLAWEDERNDLCHGDEPEWEIVRRMQNHGRLGGAINVLMAALVGYNGDIVFSDFEEKKLCIRQPS